MAGIKGQIRTTKYTDNDLLNILQSFYKKNNWVPKRREITQASVIMGRFGSFNNAVKKAGLEENERSAHDTSVLIDTLKNFYKKENRMPGLSIVAKKMGSMIQKRIIKG